MEEVETGKFEIKEILLSDNREHKSKRTKSCLVSEEINKYDSHIYTYT